MPKSHTDYRDVFRTNLQALLDYHGVSPKRVRASYRDGVKMGKPVAPRTIEYMLQTGRSAPSPSLDAIAAVAAKFDLMPWQLLVPGFDPGNPPALPVSPEERKLYESLRSLADEVRTQSTDRNSAPASPGAAEGQDHPRPAHLHRSAGKTKAPKA